MRYITKFYHTSLPDEVFDNDRAVKENKPIRSYMKPLAVVKSILRKSKFKRNTTVKIFEFVDGKLSETPVAEGVVTCHPNDDYIKSYGRFYAFRNALETTKDETLIRNRSRMLMSYIDQCYIPKDLFTTIALERVRPE